MNAFLKTQSRFIYFLAVYFLFEAIEEMVVRIPTSLISWPRPLPMHERLYVETEGFSDIPFDSLPCPGFIICPWYEIGATPSTSNWTPPVRCNPYSRLCSCLSEWLGKDNICPSWAYSENKDLKSRPSAPHLITLGVEGVEPDWWLTSWPFVEGVRKCSRSFCDVIHNYSALNVDARVFSSGAFLGKSIPPFVNGRGVINVGVSVESPNNIRKLNEESFPYTMHFGVSHRRGHLDLHTSINNYFPAQFLSKGSTFASKRDSLLFVYSACFRFHRSQLFDELSKLIAIDSFGVCKNNKDIKEEFPECATFPRSGPTVWLQSECLMHNYKFYLAIENIQEPDYITERLYQGLRAGSVPVYLGAPNIRDFLPENSAVYVEDFPTLQALVTYLKTAMADETIYNKHFAWKDLPFPGRFVNSAIEKSLDSVFCQICDHIAVKYGTELPLINTKGQSVVLPPCITRMLIAMEATIIRYNMPTGLFWKHKNDFISVYGTFQTNTFNRFELIRAQFKRGGLSLNLITAFDEVLLNEADRSCWNPSFTEFNFPHEREMTNVELSLAMKQTAAIFDAFRRGNRISLLADDELFLSSGVLERLTVVLSEAPVDWDFIFLGGCEDEGVENHGEVYTSTKIWRIKKSPCTNTYLISELGVVKVLNHLPFIAPISIHLNAIKDANIYST